jgi:hypothetical protein
MNAPDFLSALTPKPLAPAEFAPPLQKRRRKLWEIPERRHCALVGTCLPIATMRKFAARAGLPVQGTTDFQLHAQVVARCSNRDPLSESIHRFFEKRFRLAVLRFTKATDSGALTTLWREALAFGDDIPGALWAAWTHPQLDDGAESAIFGDIHMLSHQVGASIRCDLGQLERLRQQAGTLQASNDALRRGLSVKEHEHAKAIAQLQRALAAAEQRAAHFERRAAELADAVFSPERQEALQRRAESLARRAESLEERNAQNARRAAALEQQVDDLRADLAAAEEALSGALGVCEGISGDTGCGRSCPADQALLGRCVLCVGGRTGLVGGYRRIVETRGGQFLHHDGGLEESLHRIDAAIAAADAVVCQAGCVSHAAYWRLKETCKRLGKPCVFVKSPGVVSFARGVGAIADVTNELPGAVHMRQLAVPTDS